MSPPWATDDVENSPMHAQGKYAGSKAAGSSLKDVLYGGPPVVNPVSNPKSYGQHNGQHNNYGVRPAPFATSENSKQYSQHRPSPRAAPFATNEEQDPYGARRVVGSKRATQYGDKHDKFAIGAEKVGSAGFSQGNMDAAANAFSEAQEAAHVARVRQQSGSSVFGR
mmetsp:Transcript_45744/g.76241  ORF Transcript_45744/g.76241 Transcript_45744/m.76241 type:complete len:167 (-) Transcript_45744:720-1220(-)|eukprot:CAMPEP_0198210178 /NCGR_PEP_ID=MMETSP1445-20131203/19937_1 /TAXON_ID=36898 /ORGANISM="Pyramimonas sp., Strain CCMP2087" /LENGTH=166 /DNA_ID=CAMNT_0043884171 /DNA_START=78 /DNA_END=578 /DNA_ORIENTATION=-